MKKIYLTAAIVAAMSTVFMSCSNELDVPAGTAVVEGQTGQIVFNVKTGKSVSFTRNGTSEDQVINKLSVFIFNTQGNRVQGVKQDYEGTDITDGKLAVSLPADLMNKTGLKAYVVANVTPQSYQTEAELIEVVTSTPMDKVSDWGIPMASAPMQLDTTSPTVSLEASMKRTMSSLFVKVGAVEHNGIAINAGDFTYKVKNVRVAGGYMFKDEVCTGEVTAEATWTPKANTNGEELLGYMYQTDGFEVEITPSVDKPELGSASRTVVVAADKATKRNKKYVLNVLPKVTESGTIEFSVSILDWDATDGNFNVDWSEQVTVAEQYTEPSAYNFDNGVLNINTNIIYNKDLPISSFITLSNNVQLLDVFIATKDQNGNFIPGNPAANGPTTETSTTDKTFKAYLLNGQGYVWSSIKKGDVPAIEVSDQQYLCIKTVKNDIVSQENILLTRKAGAIGITHRVGSWVTENGGIYGTYTGFLVFQNYKEKTIPYNAYFEITEGYKITGISCKYDERVSLGDTSVNPDFPGFSITAREEGVHIVNSTKVTNSTNTSETDKVFIFVHYANDTTGDQGIQKFELSLEKR